MKRFIILLLAVFTMFTANAYKKVDVNIKSLKELVGTADRNKMGEIFEKSVIMEDGREVFEGINAYEKMNMAYYCIFDGNGVLKSIMFPTIYIDAYCLEMLMVNKIDYYKKDLPNERGNAQRFFYRWDGREIIINTKTRQVLIYKK